MADLRHCVDNRFRPFRDIGLARKETSGIGKADVQPAADFLGYGLRRDAGLWSEVLRNGPNHNFIDVYVGRLFDRVGDRTSDGIR